MLRSFPRVPSSSLQIFRGRREGVMRVLLPELSGWSNSNWVSSSSSTATSSARPARPSSDGGRSGRRMKAGISRSNSISFDSKAWIYEVGGCKCYPLNVSVPTLNGSQWSIRRYFRRFEIRSFTFMLNCHAINSWIQGSYSFRLFQDIAVVFVIEENSSVSYKRLHAWEVKALKNGKKTLNTGKIYARLIKGWP